MKYLSLTMLLILISACSGGSSENGPQGSFEARQDIEVDDLTGYWLGNCTESPEFEGIYTNKILSYKSEKLSFGNSIALGNENFSDSNCVNKAVSTKDLTIPARTAVGYSFTPIGIYTNVEGMVSKVLELTSNQDETVSRLAYFIQDEELYLSFESNGNYTFDYQNYYILSDE